MRKPYDTKALQQIHSESSWVLDALNGCASWCRSGASLKMFLLYTCCFLAHDALFNTSTARISTLRTSRLPERSSSACFSRFALRCRYEY